MSVIPLPGGEVAEDVRDRAVRLFTFLREYTQLRVRSVRTTDAYEQVVWLSDIPRASGCYCSAFTRSQKDAEIWVEIHQPVPQPPPDPPPALRAWLDGSLLGDSSHEAPPLVEGAPMLSPDLRVVYETYVDRLWRPWAEEDRILQLQQRIYTDLFRLHHLQQRFGEAYEVVMGVGLLAWKAPSGTVIRRHLIVAQTDVRFDPDRGVITVTADVDGARPTLEQDMVEPEERPAPEELGRLTELLEEVGDDIFADEAVVRCLQGWVQAAPFGGRYEDLLEPPLEVSETPVVHFAPALILRRRMERSVLQALDTIVRQLQQGAYVPEGVRRLVDVVEEQPSGQDPASVEDEILFPLPANDEQLEIVRRLRRQPAVLVQGPPGTGKSHTIANLVADLLAHGQRVLVTSHTARALQVLRQMIPPEIRELAVVALGGDVKGREELQNSVQGIVRRHNSWTPHHAETRIAELRKDLNAAREREAEILSRLKSVRQRDCYRNPPLFGDYEGSSQEIAETIRRRAPRHGWGAGLIDPEQECPLTDAEAIELLELVRSIDKGAQEQLEMAVPDRQALLSPDAFSALVEEEHQAAARSAEFTEFRTHPAYDSLRTASPEARQTLWNALYELIQYRADLNRSSEPWIPLAAEQVLSNQPSRWQGLERVTRETLDFVRSTLESVGNPRVTGIGDPNTVHADASALLEHLRQGGGLGVGPFRPAVVRQAAYLLDGIRVDGLPCRDPAVLERLVLWLEANLRLDRLDAEWNGLRLPPVGSGTSRASEYADVLSTLQQVLDLEPRLRTAEQAAGWIPALETPVWHDMDALRNLLNAVEASHWDAAWAEVSARYAPTERVLEAVSLKPNPHPLVETMREAVRTRSPQRYGLTYGALEQLELLRQRKARRDELLQRLRERAPRLAERLEQQPEDPEWDARLGQLQAAWHWVQADHWLQGVTHPVEVGRLQRSLDDARYEISLATRRLATELAWYHCLARLTEHERMHLVAWENAVRRIGKGTGRQAPRYRRMARDAMQGCRSAVPAWIMPIFKVAETVDIAPEVFDIVIVDEASQSGPEALFLQFLAKKVVVVGDDQQISPDNVGVEREKVEMLNAQYLHDIPLGAHYDADNSFFDLARIRFRDRVVLREHFRCMPEIIQFSNDLCYREHPLVPLKQFGAGRLAPAVQVRHVHNGYTHDGEVNDPEARAIVEQIVRCIADPAYAGKTFGVISLVGHYQAEVIDRLLARHVDPAEIERRAIVCGDPYAFQGDERDVMFLSLVYAPSDGRLVGSLTTERDRRRFNVAASRAREQMWVFHTATLDALDPEGMPARLLRYCLSPRIEPTPLGDVDVQRLRRRAAEREPGDRPPVPFDNWFEVDVFLRIVDAGYRVIPQYEIGGYRVDLLVEGLRGRLAVECEGDDWAGVEQFEEAALRQRQLERCGLPFCRIRGSAFYRDPDLAMEELWADLREHRIYPEGQEPPSELAGAADLEGSERVPESGSAPGGTEMEAWQGDDAFDFGWEDLDPPGSE